MDRRGFLKSTGAAAAAAAAAPTAIAAGPNRDVASAPESAEARTFKLQIPWQQTVAGPADMAYRLALRIKEATAGRLVFEVETEASSENTETATDKIQYGSEHDLQTIAPALTYFAGLPANAGIGASELEAWIAYGGGQDLWDDAAAKLGYKPLLVGHLGEKPTLWSKTQVSDLESLRRMRVATNSSSAALLRALGVEVADLPTSDYAEAFANGDIDAVELGSTLNAMALALAQQARYAYPGGLSQSGSATTLRIGLEVWNALSQSDQAIIVSSAREAFSATLTETRLSEAMLMQTLQRRQGLIVEAMPTEIADTLPNLAQAIVADLASRDEISSTINASYMVFRQQFNNNRQDDRSARPMA